MPSGDNSRGRRNNSISAAWPETPTERVVPEGFELTGECVIERIVAPLSDALPLLPKERERTMAGLEPGSLFVGHQNATGEESKQYPVEVAIKEVDLNESFLCGYLTIHNLTSEYPNLTTFFEADIIGPKYGFITDKWDAAVDADERHWGQFQYFKDHCTRYLFPHSQTATGSSPEPYSFHAHDVVFMRWKEHFLVPDHHVETISGASYAGFYYIAYDKRSRRVEGYYYHREGSREFQRLILEYVPRRSSATFEFH